MQTVCYHQILVPQHQIKEDNITIAKLKNGASPVTRVKTNYTSCKADYGGPNDLTKLMETATHQQAYNSINSTPFVTSMFSSGTKVDNVA